MHPVDHAQAVEAAKQIHGDETFYVEARVGSNNYRNRGGHNNPCRALWDDARNNQSADELIKSFASALVALSAPGPSRDAFDAREFVWRLMAASMRHAATRGEGETEREVMAEKFTDELLAMFSGGAGDDSLPVTEEWLRSIGFESPYRESSWLACSGKGEIRVQPIYLSVGGFEIIERDRWVSVPSVLTQTRGDVRRLLAALGITPTETAK